MKRTDYFKEIFTRPRPIAPNTVIFENSTPGIYSLEIKDGIYYLEITGGGGAGGTGTSMNYSGNGASSSAGFKGEVRFDKGIYSLTVGNRGAPTSGDWGGDGTPSSIAGLIICGQGYGGKTGAHRNQVRGGGTITKQALQIIRQDVGANGNNGGPGDKDRPGYGGASVLTGNGGGSGNNGAGTAPGAGGAGGWTTGYTGGYGATGLIRITYLRKQ